MNTETELARQLERSLDDLPTVPATAYLHQAKRVRRRRRTMAGLLAASALVVGTGAIVAVTAPGGTAPGGDVATDPGRELAPATMPSADLPADPDYTAPEPANPVEAVDGLTGVDSYSTTGIPKWAQEYGNHGPVAIAPDGRLWVAPDAVVRRTVVDPLAGTTLGDGTRVAESFAVEATFEVDDSTLGDVVWVLVYSDSNGVSSGEMDEPGRWTDDFELWVDDVTSGPQARPDFASRLVEFADDDSDVLVPREGVQVVRQLDGVELGPTWEKHPRSSVAEIRWAGKTWFVLAQGPRHGSPFFDAYDPQLSAPDLEGFVTWLRGDGS